MKNLNLTTSIFAAAILFCSCSENEILQPTPSETANMFITIPDSVMLEVDNGRLIFESEQDL